MFAWIVLPFIFEKKGKQEKKNSASNIQRGVNSSIDMSLPIFFHSSCFVAAKNKCTKKRFTEKRECKKI